MKTSSTKEKALSINLNPRVYGTIAEIGGGQETARHLFQAGGSSNTIAKSISAYDKNFSDAFYNDLSQSQNTRYVSQQRLIQMLNKEYEELNCIIPHEQQEKRFFVFANTVETINFHKTNQGHGWLGVHFQGEKHEKPNAVYIHVRLHEQDSHLQQYSLGTLGINFLYACFHYTHTPSVFLRALLDNLDTSRVEIDFAHMSGPDLDYVNNRLLNVQLVKNEMTQATIFNAQGEVLQAADMLYKKNILAFRGVFRPISLLGEEIIKQSFEKFSKDPQYKPETTITLCEITLNSLLSHGEFDEQDFLDRVDILNALGQNVMVSNCKEYYQLAEYFALFKTGKIRIVIGLPTFTKLMDKMFYTHLRAGILEAMGRLFSITTKLYVFPGLNEKGEVVHSKDIPMEKDMQKLYEFLCINKRIVDLPAPASTLKHLNINTEELHLLIQNKDPQWEELVSPLVAQLIKKNKLFT